MSNYIFRVGNSDGIYRFIYVIFLNYMLFNDGYFYLFSGYSNNVKQDKHLKAEEHWHRFSLFKVFISQLFPISLLSPEEARLHFQCLERAH